MSEIEVGEQRILHPGKLKWSLVTLIGLLFTAGGVLMIVTKGGLEAWGITVFFALMGAVGLYQLIGKGSPLTLEADGFQVVQFSCVLGFTRWDQCSAFGVAKVSGNKMVVYDRVPDEDTKMGSLNQALSGASAALGDTYGMKAQDLADLMNVYRNKAFEQVS